MVYAKPIAPTGPAASPKFLQSTHSSNPYGFTSQLMQAAKLDPVVSEHYVLFFGYEGSDPHVALQQWFPSPFKAPRNPYSNSPDDKQLVEFPTTEHYMMYHKALLMSDQDIAAQILANPHPSVSKRLGRQVKNFNRDRWVEHADQVVEEANWLKFTQNAQLEEMLLATGDRTLVEASPDDKIWGIGFDIENAVGREDQWGNNGLGKALMKVRERLRTG